MLLKEAFTAGQLLSDSSREDMCKRVLLPMAEVKIWLEHLQCVAHNRRRGATKAAETRRLKKQNSASTSRDKVMADDYYCGTCNMKYEEEMTDVDFWILCDECNHL